MASEWVRVQFVGTGPVTVLGETWYPGEVHEAPAAVVAQMATERRPDWFIRVDADVNPVAPAGESISDVTVVTDTKSTKRKG